MLKELDYFWVGEEYGGRQSLLPDMVMRFAGCAAVTACDSLIYMTLYKNLKNLCPFSTDQLRGRDYVAFFKTVKPYLRPRLMGINRLEIFVAAFKKFLKEHGTFILDVLPWSGDHDEQDTVNTIRQQIDRGFLIPYLLLHHKNPNFENYEWHWFLLTGYDEKPDGRFMVKAVTYGAYEWLDFAKLWNTGYDRKGGLILFKEKA
ncbi:hypothetical protein [uncultured Succiniclasticum sp.]|uniref:hypothetical protein n=1 Tax=uncultured Succiniclasticum sp. TaxID=1500547 RepID=UPI0025EAB4AC|nr:hypothetical protein [uncultured Succiniclasticum sp.]